MKNYFEGWKDIGEVMIPPVKQRGFRENVLRRRNIDPYNSMPEKQEDEKTKRLCCLENLRSGRACFG